MTRRQPRYILVWLALWLLVAGYGRWQATAETSPLPTGLAAPTQPTSMPEFNAPDLAGTSIGATDLQGKVVLIRFWATW